MIRRLFSTSKRVTTNPIFYTAMTWFICGCWDQSQTATTVSHPTLKPPESIKIVRDYSSTQQLSEGDYENIKKLIAAGRAESVKRMRFFISKDLKQAVEARLGGLKVNGANLKLFEGIAAEGGAGSITIEVEYDRPPTNSSKP